MRSRLLVLVSVLALLLGTFGTTLAQSTSEVFCGDLSAEDCGILQESSTAMQDVAQYTTTSSFNATVSGIPGLPADPTEVNVTVGGTFAMDEGAKAASQSLAGLSQEERMKMMSDSPQTIIDLFSGWDFDATAGVTMTPELANALSAQSGYNLPDTLNIKARMVDGILYWDLSEVSTIVPSVASGWVGFPLVDLLTALKDQGAFKQAAQMSDPAALAAADPSGATTATLGVLQLLQNHPKLFEPYITLTRGDDTQLANEAGATFDMNFDAAAFFAGPEFQQMVVDLAKAGAFESTGLTAADVEQNVQMLGMMAPMLFGGLTASAQQVIGLDDMYQHKYSSSINWDLSSLVQMAQASGQLPAGFQPTSDNVSISLATTVDTEDLATEQTTTFEAPADAAMIPLESLVAAQ